MHRGFAFLMSIAVAAAVLAGCGASDDTPKTTTTKSYSGQAEWPSSLGTVEVNSVTASEVTSAGVSSTPLATGTYDAATGSYTINDVPATAVAVVQVKGASGTLTAQLAAAIGSALGRSRSVSLPLSVSTTVAAQAVQKLVKEGKTVTAQTITNLETAAAAAASTTSITDTQALESAASNLVTITNNGGTAGLPEAMVGHWTSGAGAYASVESNGYVMVEIPGSDPVDGLVTVTSVSGSTANITVNGIPVALTVSADGQSLTVAVPGQTAIVLTKQAVM